MKNLIPLLALLTLVDARVATASDASAVAYAPDAQSQAQALLKSAVSAPARRATSPAQSLTNAPSYGASAQQQAASILGGSSSAAAKPRYARSITRPTRWSDVKDAPKGSSATADAQLQAQRILRGTGPQDEKTRGVAAAPLS